MFDVSLGSLVLLVHITAGILLIGHSAGAPYVRSALLGASTVEALLGWLDFGRRSSAANPLIALVLLASGIYLGSAGWWSQGWFYVASAAWVTNAILAAAVLRRRAQALAAAAARAGHGPVGADLDRLRRAPGWDAAEQFMLASDLAMLYVMYLKPSALESLIVMAGAFAVLAGWHALAGSRRSAARRMAPAA